MNKPSYKAAIKRLQAAAREYAAAATPASDAALREAALVYAQLRARLLAKDEER